MRPVITKLMGIGLEGLKPEVSLFRTRVYISLGSKARAGVAGRWSLSAQWAGLCKSDEELVPVQLTAEAEALGGVERPLQEFRGGRSTGWAGPMLKMGGTFPTTTKGDGRGYAKQTKVSCFATYGQGRAFERSGRALCLVPGAGPVSAVGGGSRGRDGFTRLFGLVSVHGCRVNHVLLLEWNRASGR
jgi:hypothetical protein